MPTFELSCLIALCGFAWFWFDTLKARQAGVEAARHACETEGFQLLDDTVAGAGLGLVRDGDGQIRLKRVYAFEYSDTGNNRRRGSVMLRGHRVMLLHIGLRAVPGDRILH